MAKLNWYATINRSKNNKSGTKIRLKYEQHGKLLLFLHSKWKEITDLQGSSPDSVPSFYVQDQDWEVFSKELRIRNQDDKFTKIFYKSNEICIISHNSYQKDVMDTELLRHESANFRQKERDILLSKLNKTENKVLSAIRESISWKDICYKENPKKPTVLSQNAIDSLMTKGIVAFDYKKKRYIETEV